MEEPLDDDERETFRLEPEEAKNIADLEDLEGCVGRSRVRASRVS